MTLEQESLPADLFELSAGEVDERLEVEDAIVSRLERHSGDARERDELLARLRSGAYQFFEDSEVRHRAAARLELFGCGCYVIYCFDHYGPGCGEFVKAGSTVQNPEARSYAHFVSSVSQSDVVGRFGADYVAAKRFGVFVFRHIPSAVRAFDRALNRALKPLICPVD